MVIRSLIAGGPVRVQDIMRTGVGELLNEIDNRPQPRAGAVRKGRRVVKRARKITALVLAAGQSKRMGSANKLLLNINGSPMIQHVIKVTRSSRVDRIIVVIGYQSQQIKSALKGYDVEFIVNPDHEEGLSSSLSAGMRCVDDGTEAVLICLGDMPMVTTDSINALITDFDPDTGNEICVPVYLGKRGNPVLWSRRFINEMMSLVGDCGAKHLLFKHDEIVREVPVSNEGVLIDFDTPQAIQRSTGQ